MEAKHPIRPKVTRVCPSPDMGLTAAQTRERFEAGLTNDPPPLLTRSVKQIIRDNCFTLFNLMNVVLAAVVAATGQYRQMLFLGIAAGNTLIGIIQDWRAKRGIDRLSILSQAQVSVVREGKESQILQQYLVLDDVVRVSAGQQICADGAVLSTHGLEVDESSLTGEADPVEKELGQPLLSGTTVVAGEALMRVTAVGQDNYANRLSLSVRREKRRVSELNRSLTAVLKFLSIVMTPLGLLLFGRGLLSGHGLDQAALAAVTAMIGMIPEGLMLLCGLASAVGAIRLSRRKTLVRSMSGIETLARVDVLCLDKTGTITDGAMRVERLFPVPGVTEWEARRALAGHLCMLQDDNATGRALRQFCPDRPVDLPACLFRAPFSSARKWSGCTLAGAGSTVLGAPEYLNASLPEALRQDTEQARKSGLRVLMLAHSEKEMESKTLPSDLRAMALLFLSDRIRQNAGETFRYFADQGVTLKVISGDHPASVAALAVRAGLSDAVRAVDMSRLPNDADLSQLTEKNTVFGRVSPEQKRQLVAAMQRNGHTVAMTGDGVNDLPALRQADCGVAMAAGSDAARCVADFVLLDSDFGAMVQVVGEGRRVVNNIEKVAALYLVKTIYSLILSVAFLVLPALYPFLPIQLTPISALTVGIPSFFLAMRPNYHPIRGRFLRNALKQALPAALTICVLILSIQTATALWQVPFTDTSTLCVMSIGLVGLLLLIHVARPLDVRYGGMLAALLLGHGGLHLWFGRNFDLTLLPRTPPLPALILAVVAVPLYFLLRRAVKGAYRMWGKRRKVD